MQEKSVEQDSNDVEQLVGEDDQFEGAAAELFLEDKRIRIGPTDV